MGKLAINEGAKVHNGEWPSWPISSNKELKLIKEVVKSGNWAYNGPMETEFKKRWAEFLGTKYAITAANGTVTLQIALEALGIGYGDEVIVPALTWQATVACVIDVNAVPVLVDVEEDSWCIDPDKIEEAITEKTKAIIVVHLYGSICDMDRICEIAKKHNLYIIEDAAHQHGTIFKGKKVGTFGDISSFSLQQSKTLTAGEGGILNTDNDELAVKMDALRNCGRKPVLKEMFSNDTGNYVTEGNFIQSGNYRMTEFQAAILLGQLERLPGQLELREKNALYLNKKLEEVEGITPLLRREGTELQCYFNFAFKYDKAAFGGLDVVKFRQALSAEMDYPFMPSFEPLNNCELYSPLTKKRHMLNDDYVNQIDVSRFDLPVSDNIYENVSVCAHHKILMMSTKEMDEIVESIEKIRANVKEII
jgi:L-glutamine:2-deoxy-scyllo-inosose/3-amino-2,3-dideoxy-scyllo-inosose aminotransferase